MRGLGVKAQVPVNVIYKDKCVGHYFCDLLVEDKVIVELKATRQLMLEHEAQLLNYLKATKLEVGLLLNFGVKPEIKRRVL
jgi:GxxExxY protein